jgi:hypothetical protein
MNSLHVVIFCLLIITLASCRREDSIANPDVTKEKLLGKWQFERGIDEYYKANVLISKDEEVGTPADSVIFKNDNLIYEYYKIANEVKAEIYDYNLVNDSTLLIDDELYKIRKLTGTELYVYQEEIEGVDEKYIRRGYYVR